MKPDFNAQVRKALFDALSNALIDDLIIDLGVDIKASSLIVAMELLYEYEHGLRHDTNYNQKGAYRDQQERYLPSPGIDCISIHQRDALKDLCKAGLLTNLKGFSGKYQINVKALRKIRTRLDEVEQSAIVVKVSSLNQTASYIIPRHHVAVRNMARMLSKPQQKKIEAILQTRLKSERRGASTVCAV